jgi:hypothetical protein
MALLTKKDVAEQCCKETNWLSVYIKRNKLVVIKKGANKGMIDTSIEPNKSFMKMYAVTAGIPPLKGTRQPKAAIQEGEQSEFDQIFNDAPSEPATPDENGILPVHESDRRYKHFLAVKTESAAQLDQIKIEKLKGIVIPSAVVIPVFTQHNQYIVQEQKNADEEMLTDLKQRYDISGEDLAYLRGIWTKRRNAATAKATEMSIKGVENIINDFSESRTRGQRK